MAFTSCGNNSELSEEGKSQTNGTKENKNLTTSPLSFDLKSTQDNRLNIKIDAIRLAKERQSWSL